MNCKCFFLVDIYLFNIFGNKLIFVVVIFYGLGLDFNSFVYFVEYLVFYGFVVIVLEYIGLNVEIFEKIFVGFSRFVDGMVFINCLLDIKYLLDEMEEEIGFDLRW